MKKFTAILLGILITVSLSGQEHDQSGNEKRLRHEHKRFRERLKIEKNDIKPHSASPSLKGIVQGEQRLDSLLEYERVGDNWVLVYKQHYYYEGTEMIMEYQDLVQEESTGNWVTDDREEYEYDAAGNLLLYISYSRDDVTGEWYADWKRDYAYNENNLLMEFMDSYRDAPEEEWTVDMITVNRYDTSNRLDSTYDYLLGFLLTWAINYEYDEAGNMLLRQEFNDDDAGGWIPVWMDTFIYDDNNRWVEYISYEWDEISGSWLNSDRETYAYQENDNVEALTDYDWSETENNWFPVWKEEYTYDNTYSYNELILPWFYHDDRPNYMNHKLTESHYYEFLENNWELLYRSEFKFTSDPATFSADFEKQQVSFFPNPVVSEVTFQFEEEEAAVLQVFNMAGHMVQFRKVKNNTAVNVATLPDGMYLFRLLGEGNNLLFSDKVLVR